MSSINFIIRWLENCLFHVIEKSSDFLWVYASRTFCSTGAFATPTGVAAIIITAGITAIPITSITFIITTVPV
ncbi:MAG: hypothetical protein NC393_12935 [Clostridium sp.]|nr:hypothetical protein [Clostridium sp.]